MNESIQSTKASQAQLSDSEKFTYAFSLHQQGQLSKAKLLYEAVLLNHPNHFDSLHLLGVIATQTGELNKAVELIEKAISLHQNNPSFFFNCANAQKELGQYDGAIKNYSKAILLNPRFEDAYLNQGNTFFAQNNFDAAINSFNQVIAFNPKNAQAFSNKGIVLQAKGQLLDALDCFKQSMLANPKFAEAYLNAGNIYRSLNRLSESIDNYQQAININPHYVEAFFNQGLALRADGQNDRATDTFNTLIALQPNMHQAHNNIGLILTEIYLHDEAILAFNKAIMLEPNHAEYYLNRGNIFKKKELYDLAILDYNEAILLNKNYPEAYTNRGLAYLATNKNEEALHDFNQAITLNPNFSLAYCHLGIACLDFFKLDLAEEYLNQALNIEESYDAYLNLAAIYYLKQDHAKALGLLDKTLELKPNYYKALHNKAFVLLSLGDYKQGWEYYEARWSHEIFKMMPKFTAPLWLGKESLAGKTILLYSEQGLGDSIQFCRYTQILSDMGAKVILETDPPLVELFKTLKGVDQIISSKINLPPHDVRCPLMSLPLALNTSLDTIPLSEKYLHADPEKVNNWSVILGPKNKLRIGLVWAGGARPQKELALVNQRRNVSLKILSPLKDLPVEFYSLQKGAAPESELQALKDHGWGNTQISDLTNLFFDFSDTAAFIENLDLVITVDTSTAHVAAALGKPTWILSRFDGCFRWLLDRDDSPWYSAVKLYRQGSDYDWAPVVQKIHQDLLKMT